jgi:hypothetical protein
MNTRRWIALGITALIVVITIVLINVLPIWTTLYAALAFAAGAVAGYLFKNPEIVTETVEKIVEVTKPKKVKKKVE